MTMTLLTQASTNLAASAAAADALRLSLAADRQALRDGYAAWAASLQLELYVDAISGDDTRIGTTPQTALKTLAAAIAKCPFRGVLTVFLMTDVEVSHPTNGLWVDVRGISLRIVSHGGVRRGLSFKATGSGGSVCQALHLWRGASLALIDVRVVYPPARAGATYNSPILVSPGGLSGMDGVLPVALEICDLDLPAGCVTSLIQTSIFSLLAGNIARVGGGSLMGRLWDGATNTAGTATSTLPAIITNLATV